MNKHIADRLAEHAAGRMVSLQLIEQKLEEQEQQGKESMPIPVSMFKDMLSLFRTMEFQIMVYKELLRMKGNYTQSEFETAFRIVEKKGKEFLESVLEEEMK